MKKVFTCLLTMVLLLMFAMEGGMTVFAAEGYDQVASDGDMTTVEEVGVEGMFPIYGADIDDGVYEVTVECSSSMFPVEKAVLTVDGDEMEAVLTMGGTGYLKLFMGTSKEAAAAELSEYIDFVEDDNGKHTVTIPVEALDQSISCAAFSKNKEKWYDRAILFEAKSLPEDVLSVELPDYEALEKAARDKRIEAMRAENEAKEGEAAAAEGSSAAGLNLKDGEYTIEVEMKGGTGRAEIESPATLIIKDGKAYARIVWSSSNYDYMMVAGTQYLPTNTDGNSTFEIPVAAFDEELQVTADTTAMSMPHEIEYTLIFHADSVSGCGNTGLIIGGAVIVVMIAAAAVILLKKRKTVAK